TARVPATFGDYIRIMRPDYWLKNIFIAPGVLFAIAVYHIQPAASTILVAVIGLVSACLLASANYVINEYLDADFDRHHPLKNQRAFVTRDINRFAVYLQYFVLSAAGLALASLISFNYLVTGIFLLFMGCVY